MSISHRLFHRLYCIWIRSRRDKTGSEEKVWARQLEIDRFLFCVEWRLDTLALVADSYQDPRITYSFANIFISYCESKDRLLSNSTILLFEPKSLRIDAENLISIPTTSDGMQWDLVTGTRDVRGREIREIAGTTASASLEGGSCICKRGLGTGRLSAWVAAYRASQNVGVQLLTTLTSLFSVVFVRTRNQPIRTHQGKKNRNGCTWEYSEYLVWIWGQEPGYRSIPLKNLPAVSLESC